jgi:hypothetical protein
VRRRLSLRAALLDGSGSSLFPLSCLFDERRPASFPQASVAERDWSSRLGLKGAPTMPFLFRLELRARGPRDQLGGYASPSRAIRFDPAAPNWREVRRP